jgi:hypothetical protein
VNFYLKLKGSWSGERGMVEVEVEGEGEEEKK